MMWWRRLQLALGVETAHNFMVDAAAAGLFAVFQGLTGPFIGVIAVRRGAVPWEIGWLTAVPAAALLLSSWYARLGEGRRKKPLVVLTSAIGRLFLLLTGWAHGMAAYLISFSAFNVVSAAGSPAYTAIEREIYHQRWRGRLMAGVRFVLGFCQFATVLLAGGLLDRFGVGPVFTAAVALGVGSALVFGLLHEPPPRAQVSGRRVSPLGLLRADPRLARMILAVTLVGGANFFVSPGYPIDWVQRMHLSDIQVAWISAAWALAWMVCYPLWGRLVDRRRPASALLGGLFCYLGPPLLYAFGVHFAGAVLASWIQGMGDSALDVGWQNHVMRLGGDRVGQYAGVYFTFLGARGTIMPILGSLVIAGFGLRPLFVLGLAQIACGLYVARRLPDHELPVGGPGATLAA